VQFRILGPMEVVAGSRPVDTGSPKQRAVLAMLLIEANRVVSLDRLIDQLWGHEPPARATGSLQVYVANLRRALEPDRPARAPAEVLVTQPPGYLLRTRRTSTRPASSTGPPRAGACSPKATRLRPARR
jgi:DNA-binding SARP family transcriptional activator